MKDLCPFCFGTGISTDQAKFGAAMRTQRLLHDKTLEQVAQSTGITVGYLANLELGRRRWRLPFVRKYQKAVKS